MRLKVCEIFVSLQGEGCRVGEPSLFLRLSGCNLKCPFCDTRYSWEEGKWLSVEEIAKVIGKYNVGNLVITGGEPTLQARPLLKLLDRIDGFNFSIIIETNGTVFDESVIGLFNRSTWISVSPKLGSFVKQMVNDNNVLKVLQKFSNKVYLKFVFSSFRDWLEAKAFLKKVQVNGVKDIDVFIQPNNQLYETLGEYIKVCGEFWKEVVAWQREMIKEGLRFRLRFVPQLHRVFFWDVNKGV